MITTIYANILESLVGFPGGATWPETTATHRGPSRSCLRNLGATRRRRRRCAHNEGATLYPYGLASSPSRVEADPDKGLAGRRPGGLVAFFCHLALLSLT